MTSKPRTQADRTAATRAALLDAARRLFGEHGYAAVGTEQIVRTAGVTRGALYHHFADKRALFAAVYEAVQDEVTERIDAAVSTSGESDLARLMHIGAAAWLEAGMAPDVHRIVQLDGPAVLGWEQWREVGMRYALGLVRSLLEAAIETGRIRRQPVLPISYVLIGALDEGTRYVAESADPEQALRDATAAIGQVLDGVLNG